MLSADSQIHWLSISNSCLIVLFLTGMVGMILMKTIHADFRRYSDLEQVFFVFVFIFQKIDIKQKQSTNKATSKRYQYNNSHLYHLIYNPNSRAKIHKMKVVGN